MQLDIKIQTNAFAFLHNSNYLSKKVPFIFTIMYHLLLNSAVDLNNLILVMSYFTFWIPYFVYEN